MSFGTGILYLSQFNRTARNFLDHKIVFNIRHKKIRQPETELQLPGVKFLVFSIIYTVPVRRQTFIRKMRNCCMYRRFHGAVYFMRIEIRNCCKHRISVSYRVISISQSAVFSRQKSCDIFLLLF